ncbi:MAG: metalloregulator ArsR/SmtB family transcription factor [Acidobacteria bacterium]|nr:metalloregulator ArsR/SmtB family transcription factor [Acidobacteriota bacterium]
MDKARKRDFKIELFDQFARMGKALASGRRLELIELLAQKEHTVEDLARLSDMSVANTSQHLKILRSAQLVEVRRLGLYASYRLADERVFRLWQALRELGDSRIAEIDRVVNSFLTDRKSLKAISTEELKRRLKDRSVVVLDVRPPDEYRAGHIPGARSIPVAELKARLKELPRSREIVAYCRGPYCVLADEAVEWLRARGRNALRLEQGFPDWEAQGFPVEHVPQG